MAEQDGSVEEVQKNGKFFFENDGVYEGDYIELTPEVDGEDATDPAENEEEQEAKAPVVRKRHGKGTYSEKGNTYEGEWVSDKMDGKGKFTYASKAVYNGQWVDNKYHGSGKYTWPDGSSYEGNWECNTMHGEGLYTTVEGHKFKGEYFNGKGNNLVKLL
mmetsp:Transcript_9910/g.25255  ORF Transcript_9910/g.25255 Transcript_9910/m.25255 type:complete len:160 (+) Transcript_9910:506-985(+)